MKVLQDRLAKLSATLCSALVWTWNGGSGQAERAVDALVKERDGLRARVAELEQARRRAESDARLLADAMATLERDGVIVPAKTPEDSPLQVAIERWRTP